MRKSILALAVAGVLAGAAFAAAPADAQTYGPGIAAPSHGDVYGPSHYGPRHHWRHRPYRHYRRPPVVIYAPPPYYYYPPYYYEPYPYYGSGVTLRFRG